MPKGIRTPLDELCMKMLGGIMMVEYNDLINPQKTLREDVFLDYIIHKGIDNISKEELIEIVKVHKLQTWKAIPGFNQILYYRLLVENNKSMESWTKRIGWLTLLMALTTIVQVFVAWR